MRCDNRKYTSIMVCFDQMYTTHAERKWAQINLHMEYFEQQANEMQIGSRLAAIQECVSCFGAHLRSRLARKFLNVMFTHTTRSHSALYTWSAVLRFSLISEHVSISIFFSLPPLDVKNDRIRVRSSCAALRLCNVIIIGLDRPANIAVAVADKRKGTLKTFCMYVGQFLTASRERVCARARARSWISNGVLCVLCMGALC